MHYTGDIQTATTPLQRARGCIARRSVPGDGLLFEFDGVQSIPVHMVGVFFPIRAIWLVGTRVTAAKRLAPMVGHGSARGDRLLEVNESELKSIEAGDTLEVELG